MGFVREFILVCLFVSLDYQHHPALKTNNLKLTDGNPCRGRKLANAFGPQDITRAFHLFSSIPRLNPGIF